MWANGHKTKTRLRLQLSPLIKFYELLTSPGTEVTNLIFPNEEVAWVSWKYFEDNVTTGKNVNVAVAAYVTTQARLKLSGYLRKLGKSVFFTVILLSTFKR